MVEMVSHSYTQVNKRRLHQLVNYSAENYINKTFILSPSVFSQLIVMSPHNAFDIFFHRTKQGLIYTSTFLTPAEKLLVKVSIFAYFYQTITDQIMF